MKKKKIVWLAIVLTMAISIVSCKKSMNEDVVPIAVDVPAVTVGDTLPSDYKERPQIAPVNGLKVVKNPEDTLAPSVVANRLCILFEDEDTDLSAFVRDFKRLYPKDDYRVISYDDLLKTVEIQIPEEVRDLLCHGLSSQMPNYHFVITVETMYNSKQDVSVNRCEKAGWHIDAIGLRKAWKTTCGSRKVIVAIVDDGFDLTHELFRDRIVSPYNIFTGDSIVYCDKNIGIHGTHVAGIAVGDSLRIADGVTGVAPACLLMPVQAFDGESTTTFALAAGILRAISAGADVINVSAGPSYEGCAEVPVAVQREYSKQCQKSEEAFWKMVLSRAKKHNSIVVFAAGNDHVLSCLPPQNRLGDAIVVCASGMGNEAADFSNYADGSIVSAPGVDIYSSVPDGYMCLSGTSMAAPVVTGIVALMRSVKPNMTITQISDALRKTGIKSAGDVPVVVQSDKVLENIVTQGKHNGHAYVDLGLPSGLKWATCNVGAKYPWEEGKRFAWGETNPSLSYDWSDYKYFNKYLIKYNNDSYYGIVDNKTVLDLSDDAAHTNMGGKWRMPTNVEFRELRENCYREYTDNYKGKGVEGYIIYKAKCASDKGKLKSKYGDPIMSERKTTKISYSLDDTHIFVPEMLSYWSSSLGNEPINAYALDFGGSIFWDIMNKRYFSFYVRGVCK